MTFTHLEHYKIAGQIHVKVENYIHEFIKPNMKLITIVDNIENKIKSLYLAHEKSHNLVQTPHLNNCIAFPTGICINNIYNLFQYFFEFCT